MVVYLSEIELSFLLITIYPNDSRIFLGSFDVSCRTGTERGFKVLCNFLSPCMQCKFLKLPYAVNLRQSCRPYQIEAVLIEVDESSVIVFQ